MMHQTTKTTVMILRLLNHLTQPTPRKSVMRSLKGPLMMHNRLQTIATVATSLPVERRSSKTEKRTS